MSNWKNRRKETKEDERRRPTPAQTYAEKEQAAPRPMKREEFLSNTAEKFSNSGLSKRKKKETTTTRGG